MLFVYFLIIILVACNKVFYSLVRKVGVHITNSLLALASYIVYTGFDLMLCACNTKDGTWNLFCIVCPE